MNIWVGKWGHTGGFHLDSDSWSKSGKVATPLVALAYCVLIIYRERGAGAGGSTTILLELKFKLIVMSKKRGGERTFGEAS